MQNEKREGRIIWIDIARGISIILIIMSHCGEMPQTLKDFLYSFHVPLFFIISGYLYRYREGSLKKDIKHILGPYMVVVAFAMIFQIIVDKGISIENLLKLVSDALHGYSTTIGAVWFLLTLFFARRILDAVFSFGTQKEIHRAGVFLGLTWLGVKIASYSWIPLNLDISLIAAGFMYVGYVLKKYQIKLKNEYIIFWGIFWSAAVCTGTLEISIRLYDPWYIKFAGAIAAAILIFAICQKLEKVPVLSVLLQFIGAHTLLLLCIHDLDWRLPIDIFGGVVNTFSGSDFGFIIMFLYRLTIDLCVMIILLYLKTMIKKVVIKNEGKVK